MYSLRQWLSIAGAAAGAGALAWACGLAWMNRDVLFLRQSRTTRALALLLVALSLFWVWWFRQEGLPLVVFVHGLVTLAFVRTAVRVGWAEVDSVEAGRAGKHTDGS